MAAIIDSIVPSLGNGFNSIGLKQTTTSALQKIATENQRINCNESIMTQALIIDSSQSRTHISMNMQATVPIDVVKVSVHSGLESDKGSTQNESSFVLYFYEREYLYKYKPNEAILSSSAARFLINDRDPLSGFHTAFGDSFISEIVYGRELTVSIRFRKDSQFKKTVLDAGARLHDLIKTETALSFLSEISKLDIETKIAARGYEITPDMRATSDLSTILKKLSEAKKSPSVPLYFKKTPYSEIALINLEKLKSDKDKETEKTEIEKTKINLDRQKSCKKLETRVNRACNILDTILEAEKIIIQRNKILESCDFSNKLRDAERSLLKERCDFLLSCRINLKKIKAEIEKDIFTIGAYLPDLKIIIQYLNEDILAKHFNRVLFYKASGDEIKKITEENALEIPLPKELAKDRNFRLVADKDMNIRYAYKGHVKLITKRFREEDIPKEKIEELRIYKKSKEDPLPNKIELSVEIPMNEEDVTKKILEDNLQEEDGSPTARASRPFVPAEPSWRRFR